MHYLVFFPLSQTESKILKVAKANVDTGYLLRPFLLKRFTNYRLNGTELLHLPQTGTISVVKHSDWYQTVCDRNVLKIKSITACIYFMYKEASEIVQQCPVSVQKAQ